MVIIVMQAFNNPDTGDVEANLVVRCIECGHQAAVQFLQPHLQLTCPNCGGGRFKAVPLKKTKTIHSLSLTGIEKARDTSVKLNSTSDSNEDFLTVKEVELGVYRINLNTLLDEKRKNVLSIGAREGIYVIRLPFPNDTQDKKGKKDN